MHVRRAADGRAVRADDRVAVASIATLVSAIYWARHPRRPHAYSVVIPVLCGIAFSALSVWLWANGWIGIRTWSW